MNFRRKRGTILRVLPFLILVFAGIIVGNFLWFKPQLEFNSTGQIEVHTKVEVKPQPDSINIQPETQNKVELRERFEALKSVYDRTIGYVQITAYGDIVASNKHSIGALHLVRESNELHMIDRDEKDFPIVFGKVHSDGTIEYLQPDKGFNGTDWFEDKWPRKENNEIATLNINDVVLSTKSASIAFPKAPDNMILWMFRNKNNWLISPEIDTPFLPNIIWVVKENGEIQFIHSGPDYDGYYARVGQDGKMDFFNVPVEWKDNSFDNITWGVSDERGKPTIIPGAWNFKSNFSNNQGIIIFDDGSRTIYTPPSH